MSKRRASDSLRLEPASKRHCNSRNPFSAFSDEIILRVFAYLPLPTITICQRVSQKFKKIADDNQLWKSAYYDRFVQPRLRRTTRVRDAKATAFQRASITPLWSRRLNEEAFARTLEHGEAVDWKKQYKVRHNWSRGTCDISEMPVPAEPPVPSTLARLHDSVVYVVDAQAGLRAFSYRREQKLLAHIPLSEASPDDNMSEPTSIAVEAHPTSARDTHIIVGFKDGSFRIFCYRERVSTFEELYSRPASCNGPIKGLALTWPYVLTMSAKQILSMYRFDAEVNTGSTVKDPRLLSSLRSQTAWWPLSLSLRHVQEQLIASVAYSLPTFGGGWSVGVQELSFGTDGEIVNSRLTSAVGQGFMPLSSLSPMSKASTNHAETADTLSTIYSKPSSLSYSHPYLLVSHLDNTLCLYLVTSNESRLSISSGTRLHGHTSSVFGAHVERRGKAVSVSARGNEVRVWQLEGISTRSSASVDHDDVSVRLIAGSERRMSMLDTQPEPKRGRRDGLGSAWGSMANDIGITRGWVGFDEENIVVLREGQRGSQALTVYDFT